MQNGTEAETQLYVACLRFLLEGCLPASIVKAFRSRLSKMIS